jgi:hypothetical protein
VPVSGRGSEVDQREAARVGVMRERARPATRGPLPAGYLPLVGNPVLRQDFEQVEQREYAEPTDL